MADEDENFDNSSLSSVEEDVIEELDGWMILEQDPDFRLHLPGNV